MSDLSSPQSEQSLIGTLLSLPNRIPEVILDLHADHFDSIPCRLLYEAIQEAFYGSMPIEAVALAGPIAHKLQRCWQALNEADAVARVVNLTVASDLAASTAPLKEYAALIRRYAERRALLALADSVRAEVQKDERDPGAIAAMISQRTLAIASNTVVASEVVDFGQAGRTFINTLKFEMNAAAQGLELGVKTGITALDLYTRGMRPGRLYMAAGEPGVGKSACWWVGALNYATAQGLKPPELRVGTLILSMEMGDQDSSSRFAQHLANVDGSHIQDGAVSQAELAKIVAEWGKRRDIPLYLNYAPNLRCSQMLALIAEAIRRHNVGYIVIDHFRTFDLDKRLENKVDEDEEKARFLKEQIARAMNVAVVCLAHTRKPSSDYQSGRPQLSDLRGSGQIAAHADMVSFLYRPVLYADQRAIDQGDVSETDAEMIHRKNRQGPVGTHSLYFDPSKMSIH